MRVKKGFTLIEIVVSLGIIGILMIPLANSLIMSVKTNKMGEIAQESKNISQEIVEGLRTLGDVKATTLTVGGQDEPVKIEEVVGTDGKYTVNGVVDDITLSGTIEKTAKGGTIEYDSDTYLEKEVGLVFYCFTKETSDGTEYEIGYSYSPKKQAGDNTLGGIKIKTHINKIENKIIAASGNTSQVGFLEDPNKIKFSFIQEGKCSEADDTRGENHKKCNIEVDDLDDDDDEKKCFFIDNLDVAIIVRDYRGDEEEITKGTKDTNKIGLEIRNEREDTKEPTIYFLNNRFEPKGERENSEVIPDSFDEDKFIGEKIKIKDNIKFKPINEVNNKGLYRISLETERNNVTEKTVSEFIVSD